MSQKLDDTARNPIASSKQIKRTSVLPPSVPPLQARSGASISDIRTVGTTQTSGVVTVRYTPRDESTCDQSTQS